MAKISLVFIAVLWVVGCGNPGNNGLHPEAKGGRAYGGTLRVNETDDLVTLYPHLITDAISHNIANQIYEGLVSFDPKNITKVQPCIADLWDIDGSGTVYTFKLKKGVMFHDDPCFPEGKGREVNAADFKYSFELLCRDSPDNLLYEFQTCVKGAQAYFNASKTGKPSFELEGVKVLDERTIQITLNSPRSSFIYLLAGPAGYVMPREAVEKYGTELKVGTGPFIYNAASTEGNLILTRNSVYHLSDSIGNQLPFLDSVVVSFIPDKTKELEEFKNGNIHLIFGLPAASISEMVESQIADFTSKNPKFYLYRTAELMTQFYQFNILRKPFDDVRVRKAFCYAIDREKIISDVLNTEAFGPGICGMTSPGISGYDITSVRGYNFNPDKARKFLAEAGYPEGKGFPHITIEVNSGGGKHVDVVEEVKKQLKDVLGIEIDFVVVPFSQKLEDAKYARAEMFRSGWVADYPSPENFLRTFYGAIVPDSLDQPSYPNTIRFRNAAFDSLFEKGVTSRSKEEGYLDFMKAEQLMMDEAPVIVLWYGENLKMNQSFIKNFYFNPMNYKDYSEVYIKRPSPEPADTP